MMGNQETPPPLDLHEGVHWVVAVNTEYVAHR